LSEQGANTALAESIQQAFNDLGFLFVVTAFVVILLWETFAPARSQKLSIQSRWPANIALLVIDLSVRRWGAQILAFYVAIEATRLEFGVLQQTGLEGPVLWLLALVLLDLKDYSLHRLKHWNPWLWRIHRVHHSDLEFDATTTFRFHPFETIINALVQLMTVALLGIPPTVIILYALLGYASGFFGHGNIAMPSWLDRSLRLVAVTPDMHRIHHSALASESNRNFGFLLTLWDRLLGSYQWQPLLPVQEMNLGLSDYREVRELGLKALLMLPFRTH
jgi:sterol desaturase/sphingolipid hydroxylase (fatty acid hydroxylase superfamily)